MYFVFLQEHISLIVGLVTQLGGDLKMGRQSSSSSPQKFLAFLLLPGSLEALSKPPSPLTIACYRLIVNLRVSLFYATAVLQEFILEDIRPRYELLMSWLYQEYGASEGTEMPGEDSELRQSYSDCILHLMDGLYAKLDPKDK